MPLFYGDQKGLLHKGYQPRLFGTSLLVAYLMRFVVVGGLFLRGLETLRFVVLLGLRKRLDVDRLIIARRRLRNGKERGEIITVRVKKS
jgi:hypothetical protein